VAKVATIHFDGGGQSPGPVTAACTVELSDGSYAEDVERFDPGTHNTAEWHALILGLRMALAHGARHVVVYGDSMLVRAQLRVGRDRGAERPLERDRPIHANAEAPRPASAGLCAYPERTRCWVI
jgi:ribonuclease HI